MKQSKRIAIVYDRVNSFGGAERVLMALHELYPHAILFTSVFCGRCAPWAEGWDIHTSFLQRIPFAREHHQWFAMAMPIAFESFDFSAFDVVISVTSEAAKGIVTKTGTKHICYLLTPTRYLWSHEHHYNKDYFRGFSALLLPLKHAAFAYLRKWDTTAALRPDIIIPISRVVQRRCEQYYHRQTEPVLYPPVDTKIFAQKGKTEIPYNDFYLCVARLVPYKRIDLAIQACVALQKHLVIIGKGSDEKRLRHLVETVSDGQTYVHFVGSVSDDVLVAYYQKSKAFLFPGEEDFGITVLESLAAGKPAITYEKSGNTEIMEDGKTGVVMREQTVFSLVEAIRRLETLHFSSQYLKHHVQSYDTTAFKRRWRSYL